MAKTNSNKQPIEKENVKNPTTEENKNVSHGRNHLSNSAKSSMITRILSAIVGLAILVPAIFLGDWIYFALLTFALGVACWEILGCANKRTPVIFLIYFGIVSLITYWPVFRTLIVNGVQLGKIDVYFNSIYLSIIVILVGIFFLFGLTVIYKDFTVLDACFLITMAVLIGFGFQCLFYLRYYPNILFDVKDTTAWQFTVDNTLKPSLLLLFVITATFVTDTGAYFVGVFFGKNKMNERISPKKTWEGFVGGIVISFIVSSAIALTCAACNYPIIPFLSIEKWYYIIILSLLIPLFATLGDFVFSSIKRYWGIKDYGKLIPGHGGVLDRLDSIFFAVIISSIFVFMVSSIVDGKFNWEQFLV